MIPYLLSREIKYTLSSPLVYLSFFLFCLFFIFLYSRGIVIVGIVAENEWVNSPHAISANSIFLTILSMIVALPIFYNAANREHQHNFTEIFFSTPITRFHFFWARFGAAFLLLMIPAVALVFINILGVKIGLHLGSILPEEAGSFHFSTFIKTFLFIVLPNIFIIGSLIFGLSVWLKDLAYAILGIAFLNICYLVGLYGLSNDLNNFALGALLDPFGEFAFNLDTRYFTIEERNSQDIQLTGYLLKNRILWLSLASIFLAFSYRRFSILSKSSQKLNIHRKHLQKLFKKTTANQTLNSNFPKIHSTQTSIFSFTICKNILKVDFLNIVSHLPYQLLLAALTVFQIIDFITRHHDYGVASFPQTHTMIANIRDYDVLLILFLFFYAGETIWNSRTHQFEELIDSTPYHATEAILAKVLASSLAILLLYTMLSLVAIGIQLSQGFLQIDIWQYLTEMMVQTVPFIIVWACVTIFIQSIVNHKLLGLTLSILLIAGSSYLFNRMGWETNMLKIGSNGSSIFSDLNRYGPFLKSNIWFNCYWLLFALLLLFPGILLWTRNKDSAFIQRWKNKGNAWSPPLTKIGLGLFVLWISTTGFVYYNTQILNTYSNAESSNRAKANYERKYKKHQFAPMPQIIAAQFFVHFFPKKRNLSSSSQVLIKNNTNASIDHLYFSTRDINRKNGWNSQIKIPDATLSLNDSIAGFQIYRLQKPMLPQDSFWIETIANYTSSGFENTVSEKKIVSNGSFLHHAQILPFFGYRKESEIRNPKERDLQGLGERAANIPLEVGDCTHCYSNQLSEQHSWIPMETTVSTAKDQIALSAGSLIKEWEEGGRKFFHYKVDHPSLLFNSFISADYQIASRKWKGIDLEVYYDRKHGKNVELMLDEMENSMEYYTENFGPYFHQQVRIVEFPQYNNSAQAFPGTMPYSESRGFVLDLSDSKSNNPIASTIGHEIGHQWWGHQVVGADMQGSNLLTESFAEYSSLMIMKKNKGVLGMIDFLKYDYDEYLYRRQQEIQKELPLYLVEDQPYLYYRKGSVVMYALAEMIGEEKVNRSLRNFLEEYRYQDAPFPRSTDYLRHLKKEVPDSLQYLIKDLFYDITFFDNQLLSASAKALNNGQHQIDLDISSHKIKLEEDQKEKEVALQDWFDIGIYAEGNPLPFAIESVKFNQEKMHFQLIVDQKPHRVEIDPKYLFFDRDRRNNNQKIIFSQ